MDRDTLKSFLGAIFNKSLRVRRMLQREAT